MSPEKINTLRTHYRMGDMWSPQFAEVEALRCEAEYFVECVDKNQRPINDGAAGLKVVKLIESAVKSLKMGGAVIYV